MKHIELITSVLKDFEKENVRYCVLRNYEFLTDKKQQPGFDFDVSIAYADKEKAERVFFRYGYIKKPAQFSRKHQGYAAFSIEDMKRIGFDVQWDGVVWNDMYYLDKNIYAHRNIIAGFSVLCDEDAFIMYLCHSVLGKRFFKEKYKEKLRELAAKDLDFNGISEYLSVMFNEQGLGKQLVALIKENRFDDILRMKYALIRKFIMDDHLSLFIRLFFRWVREKVIGYKYPLIAFIGPDGAGKTTTTEKLVKILQDNDRPVTYIYLGRGKGHVLPLETAGNAVYEKIKSKNYRAIATTAYYLAAPIYTLDLLLRYFFVVRPKRKKMIVVTDRYATDVYLMKKISFAFRLFLFSLFPKPTLTFYLYNDAKTLYQRKKQQTVGELQEQLDLFNHIAPRMSAIKVKTDDKEKVISYSAQKVFECLAANKMG